MGGGLGSRVGPQGQAFPLPSAVPWGIHQWTPDKGAQTLSALVETALRTAWSTDRSHADGSARPFRVFGIA